MSYYSDVALRLSPKGAEKLRKLLSEDDLEVLDNAEQHIRNKDGEFFLWRDYNHWPDSIENTLEDLDYKDYRIVIYGEEPGDWTDNGSFDSRTFFGWFERVWHWDNGIVPMNEESNDG